MNTLRGNLIIAGAILLAGLLIAYHPFQKPQNHFEFLIQDGALLQFEPSTGQVWVWNKDEQKWRKFPKPQ